MGVCVQYIHADRIDATDHNNLYADFMEICRTRWHRCVIIIVHPNIPNISHIILCSNKY